MNPVEKSGDCLPLDKRGEAACCNEESREPAF